MFLLIQWTIYADATLPIPLFNDRPPHVRPAGKSGWALCRLITSGANQRWQPPCVEDDTNGTMMAGARGGHIKSPSGNTEFGWRGIIFPSIQWSHTPGKLGRYEYRLWQLGLNRPASAGPHVVFWSGGPGCISDDGVRWWCPSHKTESINKAVGCGVFFLGTL